MTRTGHISQGQVVFDKPASLPDGTPVGVELMETDDNRPTLLERLGNVFGKAKGLPEEAAQNADHYLYGHPRH